MTLRVALVGCGVISVQHLDAIAANPDAELVAVCDVDLHRAKATALQHSCRVYDDFDRMLEVERPEVVHICTPHFWHAPMAIAALRRGVNVLLEKPVATTVADGEAVARATEESGAVLGACYQNRYNNTAKAMHDLLAGGSLGRVRGGRATVNWFRDNDYYARRPWRGTWAEGGGGVLINQSIHTLDLLQWFLGDVMDVRGRAARLTLDDPVEVEDTASIVLRHRGGSGSIFHASNGYVDDASVMVEVLTEHARVRLETDLTVHYSGGATTVTPEEGIATGDKAYWGLSHSLLIADFYRHVQERRPFWINALEALKTLRIVTAVYEQSDCPPSPDRVSPPALTTAADRSGPYSENRLS